MKILFIVAMLVIATSAQFNPFGAVLNTAQNVAKGAQQAASTVVGGAQGAFSNVNNFAGFLAATGKKYASKAEATLREGIFLGHKQLVDTFNSDFLSGKSTFSLGLNPFSDLRPDEFLKALTGLRKSPAGDKKAEEVRHQAAPSKGVVPDSFDWREKGGVTPIKFQGLECGACWSFAVTGAIEGHHFRKTGQLVPLSEQNLVDCGRDFGNTGCDGGFQEYGFAYVTHNKGISKAPPYPYVEKDGQCRYNEAQRGAQINGYARIRPGNENKIKEVVALLGPVAASVNASPETFQLYQSGIYTDEECNKEEVNHSVLIVGYGSENGQDYWIIKNSWTEKWGENGYMRLPRNKNFCGIASEASYPIV